jgi:hypothetical protein
LRSYRYCGSRRASIDRAETVIGDGQCCGQKIERRAKSAACGSTPIAGHCPLDHLARNAVLQARLATIAASFAAVSGIVAAL